VLGSFADMPTDLKEQIEKLEEAFTIPTAKLKEISEHFLGELKRGLSKEGGTIVGLNASGTTNLANKDSP
jgi:hexokinase